MDGIVQVPPDSTGKKIDTAELTRPDTSVVERQRVVVPDPVLVSGDILTQMLIELRLHSILLAVAFNVLDDLDAIRNDMTTSINTQ